jgi:glyoxylase-like metal-dependent hydrolase (beta-lactamase superfamily II)
MTGLVRGAAARHFGSSPPVAIVQTHGHFDHTGGTRQLASEWGVPVYAHPLEFPYLRGDSDYPPKDPTVGGALGMLSRVVPDRRREPVTDLRPLEEHTVPGAPGWRWLHTPGHAPGHVSLFREEDRLLLAGDAVATMNVDSWLELVRRAPEVCRPPAPFTVDWQAAHDSVRTLAALEPRTIGAGHGLPVSGEPVAAALHTLAEGFPIPSGARYTHVPAFTGPAGVEWVPPPAPDPFPVQALGAVLTIAGAVGLAAASGRRRRRYRL